MVRSALAGLFGFGVFVGAVYWTPAAALEPAELRGQIEDAFRVYNAASGAGSQPYQFDSVDVKPQGKSFRVTLSGVRLTVDPEEQAVIEVGAASFTMTPASELDGEPTYRISDLDVPKRWLLKEGAETGGAIEMESLTYEGLWSFAYLSNLDGELAAGKVSLEVPDGTPVAFLESSKGSFKAEQTTAGRFDFVGDFRSEGLRIEDEEFLLELGSLGASAKMPDYDLAGMADAMRKAAEAGAGQAASDGNAFTSFLSDMWSQAPDSRFDMSAKGLKGLQQESKDTFEIDAIDFGYGVSSLANALSKVDFSLAQSGLRVGGPDAETNGLSAALMPADGTAVLTLDRFPLATVMKLAAPLAKEAAAVDSAEGQVPQIPDGMAQETGLKVLDALVASGTSLDLSGTRFATPESEITFKGGFVVDPAAAFAARGTLLIEAVGFDSMIELAKQSMNDPDPEVRENAMGAMNFLGMIKTYADRDSANPERPVDRFQVELAANGALTVNGLPILPGQPAQ